MGVAYKKNPYGGIILNTDNDVNRRFVEYCYRTTSTMVNPIIDWEDNDVWDFLHYYGCKSNPLYECGFRRIGCIGCPMGGAKSMKKEFALYPKYKENYIRAFDRMLKRREDLGKPPLDRIGNTGEAVFKWWIGDDPRQISLFDAEYDPDWHWV